MIVDLKSTDSKNNIKNRLYLNDTAKKKIDETYKEYGITAYDIQSQRSKILMLAEEIQQISKNIERGNNEYDKD